MMTQTHLLAAAALFARPGEPARNGGIVAGALLPDAAIYGLFAWSALAGVEGHAAWDRMYWSDGFQGVVSFGNSLFVWLAVLVSGFFLLRVPSLFRLALFVFFAAAAALLHLALDWPVHHSDAHAHLWPFSDWRFRSPVSYWDPRHHGQVFKFVEGALGVVLVFVVARRFRDAWVRAALAVLAAAYVVVPLYFAALPEGVH